jgi:hypothetical protein
MESKHQLEPYDWRRLVVGILSFVCLGLGILMYCLEGNSPSGTQGILVRLGLVLATIWLAFPQLGKLTLLQSAGAMLIMAALIVLAASRPNIFRVAATILLAGLAINWGLTWISRLNPTKK